MIDITNNTFALQIVALTLVVVALILSVVFLIWRWMLTGSKLKCYFCAKPFKASDPDSARILMPTAADANGEAGAILLVCESCTKYINESREHWTKTK